MISQSGRRCGALAALALCMLVTSVSSAVAQVSIWLAALDDFRNWLSLGLPAREKR